jgi:hypothetical protein
VTEFKTGDRVQGKSGFGMYQIGTLKDRPKDLYIREDESLLSDDDGRLWYVLTDSLEPLDPPEPEETPRGSVLLEARDLITGDRNKTYGSPTQNFQDTADIWDTLLKSKLKEDARIEPGDVARLMIALKLCRMVAQPKRDNWTDIAGYAGCGYEVEAETGKIQE